MKINKPNYKLIYTDIIRKEYPEKMNECNLLLQKKELTFFDIMEINNRIFGSKKNIPYRSKFRSYSRQDIIKILEFQKNNNLSNTEVAQKFKMSRNTIGKWKKLFII